MAKTPKDPDRDAPEPDSTARPEGPGRRATLPPPGYRKPARTDASGLVVRPVGDNGENLGTWDFTAVPGAPDLRDELVGAFVRYGELRWNSYDSYETRAKQLRQFLAWSETLDIPITKVAEITPFHWATWAGEMQSRLTFGPVVRAVDSLEPATRRQMERSRRWPSNYRQHKEALTKSELKKIRHAAARTVRSASLRIADNIALLERWRAGQTPEGTSESHWGEVLDYLDRHGHVPKLKSGQVPAREKRLFGEAGAFGAVARLYPTFAEAGAAAVLLICHEGWNASVLRKMTIPRQWPNADADEVDPAVYRMETDKRRRGARRRHNSNNLLNAGPQSAGWAIQQVMTMTQQARESLDRQGRPTTALLAAFRKRHPQLDTLDYDEGVERAIGAWHQQILAAGVDVPPSVNAQRLRHSAQVHHGKARNNIQSTQDSDYLLRDKTVREESRGAVEAGLNQAVTQAHAHVSMRMADSVTGSTQRDAELLAKESGLDPRTAQQVVSGQLKTAVASCTGFDHSPFTPVGPCAVSFLLCFACNNSIATGADLPRIIYLYQSIGGLRSAVTPAVWDADWAAHHARVGDFLTAHTTTETWPTLLAKLTDRDKKLIERTLDRRLDA